MIKRLTLILLSLALLLSWAPDPYTQYIEKYSQIAISEMQRTGVPASITLAQGLLESRAGQSPLATKGNNHFGIKCHNDWTGKTQYVDDEKKGECFRVYSSAEASFRAHSDFLRSRDRYKGLFELDTRDYKAWASGLKKAGYATDPAYADKLVKLIEDYRLDSYDRGVEVASQTPLQVESSVKLEAPVGEYKESVRISFARDVYIQNGARFVYAFDGDTYSGIAGQNGLFVKEVLRYNDVSEDSTLKAGDIVYISGKKSKAARGVGKYIVTGDDETLWEISQRFGVKLSSLIKLNPAFKTASPEDGDTIFLRKDAK